MKTLEQHIEEVFDWFEFEKVSDVMLYMNWTWTSLSNETTLMIVDLKEIVRELMQDIYKRAGDKKIFSEYIATGGFKVSYTRETDKDERWDRFDVVFELANWSTES